MFPDITLQAGDSDKQGKSNMSINIEKYNVSRGQIEQLQVEAKTVLTEKLLKKVIETEAVSFVCFFGIILSALPSCHLIFVQTVQSALF